jgi:hypothetical protein
MWANIPIVGWIIALIFDTFLAIPTYFLWKYVVPKYFNWMPEVWHRLPFWDIVWMVMLISIVKHVVLKNIFNTSIETSKDK